MIKEKMLLIAFFFLQAFAGLLMAQKSIQKIHVKIRIIEGNTHQTTPAMVCITGIKDGKVRVPPLAIIPDSPSEIKAFYTGIDFKKDKNWIGPVRMTNGIGNNQNRSDIYELLPFELKRWINLPHYGWYSGDVHVHHPTTKPQFKEFLFEYAKSEDIHFVNVLEKPDLIFFNSWRASPFFIEYSFI